MNIINPNNYYQPDMPLIRFNKVTFTLYELYQRHARSLLRFPQEFENTWPKQKKSELIESIMLGIPLPVFYFIENQQGNIILLDGKKRLFTLFDFFSNKFELKNINILRNFNTLSFNELDAFYQSQFANFQITGNVIHPSTHPRLTYELIHRINGNQLSLKEKQILIATLLPNNYFNLLNYLFDNTIVKEIFFNKNNPYKKSAPYILLRFISLYLYFETIYKSPYVANNLSKLGDLNDLLFFTLNDGFVQNNFHRIADLLENSNAYYKIDLADIFFKKSKYWFEAIVYIFCFLNHYIDHHLSFDDYIFILKNRHIDNLNKRKSFNLKILQKRLDHIIKIIEESDDC